MAKSPQTHLDFILDTLESIRSNTPASKPLFMKDPNAQDATLMRIQDIGEQLARIRDGFPDYYNEHQADEWHKLIGLRNIISHGYREIDFAIIWEVISRQLNDFAQNIAQLAGRPLTAEISDTSGIESELWDAYYDSMELLDAGDLSRAEELLKETVRVSEGFVPAHVGLVAVYQAGGYLDAIREYSESGYTQTRRHFKQWPNSLPWGDIDNRPYLRASQLEILLHMPITVQAIQRITHVQQALRKHILKPEECLSRQNLIPMEVELKLAVRRRQSMMMLDESLLTDSIQIRGLVPTMICAAE